MLAKEFTDFVFNANKQHNLIGRSIHVKAAIFAILFSCFLSSYYWFAGSIAFDKVHSTSSRSACKLAKDQPFRLVDTYRFDA